MSDKYPTAGLKPCPFCGQDVHPDYDFPQYVIHQTNKNGFNHSRLFMNRNDWNIRPIEDELRARIAELEAENNRLAELLLNELSQVEIATDLGNKRWVALNDIYENGEKHNANWCKRKAQEGLGIK